MSVARPNRSASEKLPVIPAVKAKLLEGKRCLIVGIAMTRFAIRRVDVLANG